MPPYHQCPECKARMEIWDTFTSETSGRIWERLRCTKCLNTITREKRPTDKH